MPGLLHAKLPEFLGEADGEIRLTGHRISLYDVLWEYNQGRTVEELTLRFPTLKRSTIHKLMAFYLDNQPEVDAFLTDCDMRLAKTRAGAPPAPSVAELQRRLENIRRAAQHATQISH